MDAYEYEAQLEKERKGNCRNYCHYARYCYAKGETGIDPYECANYYHIDDIIADARDIEQEQRASLDDYDEWE